MVNKILRFKTQLTGNNGEASRGNRNTPVLDSKLPFTNCCSANSGQRRWDPTLKMSPVNHARKTRRWIMQIRLSYVAVNDDINITREDACR